MTNLDRVAEYIAVDEGGVANVGDGKGITRYGQTDDWLTEYGLPVPDSREAARLNTIAWIYLIDFEPLVERDVVFGTILCTFAFHSHAKTATKALQHRLGLKADGVLGPITEAHLDHVNNLTLRAWVMADYTRRLTHLLGSKKTDRRRWAAGWGNRLARLIDLLGG